jgi:hypothetical protein
MLSTDKISRAFHAIIEEAEAAGTVEIDEEARQRLRTIISIAKHQNDVRGAAKGSCSHEAATD